MITNLHIRGFKDQDRAVKLSGLDLFTSNNINGVGKSSVLEGFKLALLGEIPGRARTVEDLFKFTSFPDMQVGFDFQREGEDISIERCFLRKGPPGGKRSIFINGRKKSFEEGDRWIREHLGAVSISFDPHEFLNLTDSRKKLWILSNSPESIGLSFRFLEVHLLGQIINEYFGSGLLQTVLSKYGFNNIDDLEDSFSETIFEDIYKSLCIQFQNLDPHLFNVVNIILKQGLSIWNDSVSVQEKISAWVKYLKDEIKRLKITDREQSAGIAGLKFDQNKKRNGSEDKISEYKNSLNRISIEIYETEKTLQDRQNKILKRNKINDRKRFLQVNIDELLNKTFDESKDEFVKNISYFKTQFIDTDSLELEIKQLSGQLQEIRNKAGTHEQQEALVSQEFDIKSSQLNSLGCSDFQCPLGSDIRCDTNLVPYRENLVQEVECLSQKRSDSRIQVEIASDEIINQENMINQLTDQLVSAQESNRFGSGKIQYFTNKISHIEKSTVQMQAKLNLYQEELVQIQIGEEVNDWQSGQDIKSTSELETLKEDLLNKKEIFAERLEQALREGGKYDVFKDLNEKNIKTRETLNILDKVHLFLGPKGVQGKLALRVGTALENEVNGLLTRIDSSYRFSLDLTGDKLVLGWDRQDKVIPLNTLNSAHFVLFMVPFLTAILNRLARVRSNSGFPTFKALCIEGESLTPGNLCALLKGLSLMKESGFIDQALVAHYRSVEESENLSGFTQHIIQVGSQKNVPATGFFSFNEDQYTDVKEILPCVTGVGK